jgi:hypothetical protein
MFRFCAFPDGALRALAHLLRSGRVADLTIIAPQPQYELAFGSLSAGVVALCGALRDCTSLTSLELSGCRMPHGVYTALLAAVTGHAKLRRLHVEYNLNPAAMDDVVGQRAVGAALAALLAANAPSMRELEVHDALSCREGLAPLCAALHGNAFLHRLSLLRDDMSVAFAADVLAPAAHACVTLRALESVSGNQLGGMGTSEGRAIRERQARVRRTIADVHAELAARAAQPEHTQQQ